MNFDPTKVQFTQEELEVAAEADEVLEAVLDGIGVDDLDVVGKLLSVARYLLVETGGNKAAAGERMLALGMMLVRDNIDFTPEDLS